MAAYVAHYLVMVGIYTILAVSLNLLVGYAGIFSLAHAAVYGIGAYASALARGLGLQERIRFASAAAALKATHRGGQAGIPTRAGVEDFLASQPH